MNEKLSTLAVFLLICVGVFVGILQMNNHRLEKEVTNLTEIIRTKNIELDKNKELSKLIESDKRLQQHIIAVRYSKLSPTPENIKSFLKEADSANAWEAFESALRETQNGITGIGPILNNHFGMKNAGARFSWKDGINGSGYAIYNNWVYSYLDYISFKASGYKTWRKDLRKNKH